VKKALVIGGGFAGCTAALLFKEKGFDITLIEKEDVLGGGCRTYFYKGHPYTFGPRHLNVKKSYTKTWEFVNKYFDLRELKHYACTLPAHENKFFQFPPCEEDIVHMNASKKIVQELSALENNARAQNFEDYWIKSFGKTLYEEFIDQYSKKMWDIDDNKVLDLANIPVHKRALHKKETDYFNGEVNVMYPKNIDAYNPYFDECVRGAKVFFKTTADAYDIQHKKVKFGGIWQSYDVIISTISLDEIFDHCYGELKYMGRDFFKVLLPIERVTPEPYCFLYYAGDEPYTRIVEYKIMTGYVSRDTLLGIEIPSHKNKMYPFSTKAEIERAAQYKKLLPNDVYSIGRLGTYQYNCMADIIDALLTLIEKI
jgi:UDP-galactopyranose mutase